MPLAVRFLEGFDLVIIAGQVYLLGCLARGCN